MDDLISREWVKKRMVFEPDYEAVLMAPKVDAVPVRHARWTVDGECSLCGKFDDKDPFGSEYCPNCWAKMDGGSYDEKA